jgi:hypothetical protein
MVHALEEIRQILLPGGVLIDIRPLADHWRVGVGSARGFEETGHVIDLPVQTDADEASNEAMREVESRGWFTREQEECFPFFYSWDSPREMEEFIATEWTDFAELSEDVQQATRSAWAISDADSTVQVNVKILITKWKKE